MILDKIVENKRTELTRKKQFNSISDWKNQVQDMPATRDFKAALQGEPKPRIIAEIKKASPSRGIISNDFDPVRTARSYETGGAAAISVLTEEKFFQGHPGFISLVKGVTTIPILRKDFLFDPWQIYESRAIGADAILLIASLLEVSQLKDFLALAGSLGLACLTEVHNELELDKAQEASAPIIGINNRNLKDFTVTLETTKTLVSKISDGPVIVSESGIHTFKDMKTLLSGGVSAMLIGEALMDSKDPVSRLRELQTGETV